MAHPDRELTRALAATILLVVLVGLLGWGGVRTGDLALDQEPAPASTAASIRSGPPMPTPTPVTPPVTPTASPAQSLVPPDPALATAFAAETARLGGVYALAWVDADGVHLLGSVQGETAWSTIKVPLAVAAAARTPSEETWRDIARAITLSDNAAAASLWSALGPPEEAAAAVDKVLAAYGSPEVRTERADVRPPFSPYGQTAWSTESQARFASSLVCVPDSSAVGLVRAEMARVVPDQRWGIADLGSFHVKGGWGPEASGAYVLRQLGDAEVAGERFALALSVRSSAGRYPQGAADATALVRWWARTVAPAAPGLDCPGR